MPEGSERGTWLKTSMEVPLHPEGCWWIEELAVGSGPSADLVRGSSEGLSEGCECG